MESLKIQYGGDHYKKMGIEPLEFCAKNMTPEEIKGLVKKDVLKYLWREKDGIAIDWGKAKHLIEWGLEALGCSSAKDNTYFPPKEKFAKDNTYFFPKAKFANINDGDKQLAHMMTEAQEFINAYTHWVIDPSTENYEAMLDEGTDFVHSRETYSRIDYTKLDMLIESEQRVVKKNQIRGYYEEEKND